MTVIMFVFFAVIGIASDIMSKGTSIIGGVYAVSYTQLVKPPHLTLDLELLKESTINTTIGRYRNKKISPIYTPVSYTHLDVYKRQG